MAGGGRVWERACTPAPTSPAPTSSCRAPTSARVLASACLTSCASSLESMVPPPPPLRAIPTPPPAPPKPPRSRCSICAAISFRSGYAPASCCASALASGSAPDRFLAGLPPPPCILQPAIPSSAPSAPSVPTPAPAPLRGTEGRALEVGRGGVTVEVVEEGGEGLRCLLRRSAREVLREARCGARSGRRETKAAKSRPCRGGGEVEAEASGGGGGGGGGGGNLVACCWPAAPPLPCLPRSRPCSRRPPGLLPPCPFLPRP